MAVGKKYLLKKFPVCKYVGIRLFSSSIWSGVECMSKPAPEKDHEINRRRKTGSEAKVRWRPLFTFCYSAVLVLCCFERHQMAFKADKYL